MAALSNGGGRLAHALDREVLAIAQKFIDDESSPLPHASDIYNHIMRSNSPLKRRSRKQLEASIDRVLSVLKEDREAEDSDASGVMDAIEGDFADEKGPRVAQKERSLNKGLTRLWATNSNGGSSNSLAASSASPAKPANADDTVASEGNVGTEAAKRAKRSQEQPPTKRRKVSEPDRSPPQHADFDRLGGVQEVRNQLEDLLTLPLLRPDIFEGAEFEPPRGILLYGPPGCGKTAIANATANAMRVPFIAIPGPSVVSGMSGESERALRDHFEEARKLAPCIIFIDEIDAITPKRESAQRQMETRIVAQLLTCMDELADKKAGRKPVVVIAATNRPDSLDPALRRGGRFGVEINMSMPDEPARYSILEAMTRRLPIEGDVFLRQLAKRTSGFVGADLRDLVNRTVQIALRRFRLTITNGDLAMEDNGPTETKDESTVNGSEIPSLDPDVAEFYRRLERVRASKDSPTEIKISQQDFDTALPLIQPSAKREGFATVPNTSWQNVGALKAIREELTLKIVEPILDPDWFRSLGISPSAGVLLWGPPGCGKTLLAKAVANESKTSFISVKGPELMNKYVGESEKAIRTLFTRARSSAPCVIFFDELDALAPNRNNEMTESSTRVVNSLLTEMDGLEGRENIFIIGATNRPDMIDPAIMRPGRLGSQIYVDLPGPEERVDILKTLCRMAGNDFYDEVADVARKSEGFSGADLEALRYAAALEAYKRRSRVVEAVDWRMASAISPSVGRETHEMYKKLEKRMKKTN